MYQCLNSLHRSKSSRFWRRPLSGALMKVMAAPTFMVGAAGRNRLLVEGSSGSAPSGAVLKSVAVAPSLLVDAVLATWTTCGCAKMLFKCAVSIAVSCLPLGLLSWARARLDSALSSHIAREVSVVSSLFRRGRWPEFRMFMTYGKFPKQRFPKIWKNAQITVFKCVKNAQAFFHVFLYYFHIFWN